MSTLHESILLEIKKEIRHHVLQSDLSRSHAVTANTQDEGTGYLTVIKLRRNLMT